MIKITSFRREKIKLFLWTIGFELMIISACALMIGLVIIFWRWAKFGLVPPLTDRDIADLTRLSLNYSISGWWELLFIWLWAILLYFIGGSRHLKRKIGAAMKIVFFVLVFGIGLYGAITFRGAFYGVIISLIFVLLPPGLLFAYFLWRKVKPIFDSSPDPGD